MATRSRDTQRRDTFIRGKLCAGLPFFALNDAELQSELENVAGVQQRDRYSKPNMDRQDTCSVMPGAELSDREFRRLLSRPDDRQIVINCTLLHKKEIAENRTIELEKELENLKLKQVGEMEQMKETLNNYKFDADLCRLKIADLEERNRQLKESFDYMNTACIKLLEDKKALRNTTQACFENLDKYKELILNTRQESDGAKDVNNQTDQVQTSVDNSNCEWCSIVRAFYRVCMPE